MAFIGLLVLSGLSAVSTARMPYKLQAFISTRHYRSTGMSHAAQVQEEENANGGP